jgi:gas vesicle protein
VNRDTIVGFGVGLLIGVVIGGVTALLYAPKSGEETRGVIKSKTEKFVGDVRAKLNKSKISDLKPM